MTSHPVYILKKNYKLDGGPSDSQFHLQMWIGWLPIRFTF